MIYYVRHLDSILFDIEVHTKSDGKGGSKYKDVMVSTVLTEFAAIVYSFTTNKKLSTADVTEFVKWATSVDRLRTAWWESERHNAKWKDLDEFVVHVIKGFKVFMETKYGVEITYTTD